MDVISLIVILASNSVIAVFIEEVSQGIVIALVRQDIEAIFIKGPLLSLNLLFRQLDAKDAAAILVESVASHILLWRNVDSCVIVEASDRINAILIVVITLRVVETTLVKEIEAILVVMTTKLFDRLLIQLNELALPLLSFNHFNFQLSFN